MLTEEAATLEVILHHKRRSFRIERVGIFFDESFREIVDMLG